MTLIFDYDGTLHNTTHVYGCSFRAAYAWLVAQGYAPERYYPDEAVTKWLGMTAQEMWTDFMPELPDDIWRRANDIVAAEMARQVLAGCGSLYAGIPEALDLLRAEGFRMVILSNCMRSYMAAHRTAFLLDRWFSGYFCAEDYRFIPKEEMFLAIREQFPDAGYLVVGDRASDCKVGLVHGLPTIGCAYGFGTEEELGFCTAVIRSPDQLPQTVRRLSASVRIEKN